MKNPCVYILASKRNGTLYTGVTRNLTASMAPLTSCAKPLPIYGVHRLVWYEVHPTLVSAIAREKAIKEWEARHSRNWRYRPSLV